MPSRRHDPLLDLGQVQQPVAASTCPVFNLIAPAAQAERHVNKSAVNPANTLATRPFVIPVSDAETGTLYGITEVEWNRNSER